MFNKSFEIARQIAALHRQKTGPRPLFQASADGQRGNLHIYEVIGEDWWTGEGVTAKKVSDALAEMKAKGIKALDIFINSEGGDIFEAKAIYSQLRRFEGERTVHIDGLAASAATFIAMAGDKIITAPYATWMIHEVWARGRGRAQDLRALADVLELENKLFAETYAKRSGQKVEDVLAWMAAETWMTAADAKDRGFTDEIAEDVGADQVNAALASPKNMERFLREAGLPRSVAKAVVAGGYERTRDLREADAADEEQCHNDLREALMRLRTR